LSHASGITPFFGDAEAEGKPSATTMMTTVSDGEVTVSSCSEGKTSSEMLDPNFERERTFARLGILTRLRNQPTLRDERVSVKAASSDVSAGRYVTPLTSVSPSSVDSSNGV
jgi:hypothetical protein